MNEIQSKINELKEKGWTKKALADELGITWQALHNWETGDRFPENAKAVSLLLDSLLVRKRIPKRRRYDGTHHLQKKKAEG